MFGSRSHKITIDNELYDRLEKADLQAMAWAEEPVDLVTAADVFMYVGALERVTALAASMLRADGLFAFSVERHAGLVTGGTAVAEPGHRFNNTLLIASGEQFLASPERLQTEAFGNAALFVVAKDSGELCAVAERLEGSLTGCLYTDTRGSDDALHDRIEPALRARVGRLLNDKMPTGVAVTAAMNHGGPYPSTGHPGFTAVGIDAPKAAIPTDSTNGREPGSYRGSPALPLPMRLRRTRRRWFPLR